MSDVSYPELPEQTKMQAQIEAAIRSIEDHAVSNIDDGLVWRMMSCMSRTSPSPLGSTNSIVETFQGKQLMLNTPDARDDAEDTALLGTGSSGAMQLAHCVLGDGKATKKRAAQFAAFLEKDGQGCNEETMAVNALLSRLWPGKAQFASGYVLIKVFGSKKALVAYLTKMYGDAVGAKAIANVAFAMHEFFRISYEYAEPIAKPAKAKTGKQQSYTTKASRGAEMLADSAARKAVKAVTPDK